MVFRKGLFSQRNKLIDPKTVFIRGKLTREVINAIDNCYISMWNENNQSRVLYSYAHFMDQEIVERELWTRFLGNHLSEFKDSLGRYLLTFSNTLRNESIKWDVKMDMLEYTIKYIQTWLDRNDATLCAAIFRQFIVQLNDEFERLDFAYRISDGIIMPISDDYELSAIDQANRGTEANVKEHLQKAMQHLSKRSNADASNSIKESISALEAVCRDLTGEATLGKSLKKLEARGIPIHPHLKEGLEKIYMYTNQSDTGIRHALMDADGDKVPSKDEAHLMLVLCSAFINYLRAKSANHQ